MNQKVCVGYCHGGNTRAEFTDSLVAVFAHDARNRRLIDSLISVGGLYIAENRNTVVKRFLEREAGWLWFLDSDIKFHAEALYGLLDSADPAERPIVSALYFSNVADRFTAVWLKHSKNGKAPYETLAIVKPELQEVDAVGMGCCLIHRSVFEGLQAKIEDEWTWFGHDPYRAPSGKLTHLGEDVTFCRRAQELGAKIWAHGGIVVDHIKNRAENIETFLERYGQGAVLRSTQPQ